jgi:hypothetical protein
MDISVSHRYNVIGDQKLYVGVLILIRVNLDLCAHYIGAGVGSTAP